MKKLILSNLLLFIVLLGIAQAPQGLNYQAVAYNAGGTPVINQGISVRLSILDGSATGTTVYQETQNPTTDNTGLFSIVIGNGVVVSGTFASINWGNGSKWLKTEIDITGSINYLVMGTSQFMSVPYALYANKAGFNSGSFTIPDGFDNATTVVIPNNTDYIVPIGKNLYLPSAENALTIDGDTLFQTLLSGGSDARTFVGASENSVVNFKVRDGNLLPSIGFLVDKKVQWKTIEVSSTPFSVPTGKQFVVVNITANYLGKGLSFSLISAVNPPTSPQCYFSLNGSPIYLLPNTILQPGSIVTATCPINWNGAPYFTINGYFTSHQ